MRMRAFFALAPSSHVAITAPSGREARAHQIFNPAAQQNFVEFYVTLGQLAGELGELRLESGAQLEVLRAQLGDDRARLRLDERKVALPLPTLVGNDLAERVVQFIQQR